MLFQRKIGGWESWGSVFCDLTAFAPLIGEICHRHGLPEVSPTGLTPGTNAVFRVGDYVVKIYAPAESGIDDDSFGRNEWQAGRAAHTAGVRLCTPLYRGCIEDAYSFYYVVMEYVTGQELGDVLSAASPAQRRAIGGQMSEVCQALHRADGTSCPACRVDLLARTLGNFRWAQVPESLALQLKARAQSLPPAPEVLVHGDLTGENILLREGAPLLIDFGDAVMAPACYELPSLIIEGLRADPDAVRGFWQGDLAELAEQLLDGLSLHDFGGNLIAEFAKRQGIAVYTLTDIPALRAALLAAFAQQQA